MDLSALSTPAELIDALTKNNGRTCMARTMMSEDSEEGSKDDTETTVSVASTAVLKPAFFVVGPADEAPPTSSGVYYSKLHVIIERHLGTLG